MFRVVICNVYVVCIAVLLHVMLYVCYVVQYSLYNTCIVWCVACNVVGGGVRFVGCCGVHVIGCLLFVVCYMLRVAGRVC